MFKIESYITPLLMGYVDKYVNLRPEDFQLSLWGGDLVLNNLDLRLEALEKAIELPIMFKSGHIHELRIHVPWTKLGSEPVVVTINTIECILKLRDTAYAESKSSKFKEGRRSRSAQQLRQRPRKQDEEELPPGYLQSLVNKILNNISVIVNNLIIKFVEDDIVLSLNVKSAECYSVNELWNRSFVELSAPDFVLRKAVNFGDLTVCLDKCDASGRIRNYQDPLIYRCSVYGRVYTKYDSMNSKLPSLTKFDVFCDKLDISLTDVQLPMFIRLIEMCIALYMGYIEFPTPLDLEGSDKEEEEDALKSVFETPSLPQPPPPSPEIPASPPEVSEVAIQIESEEKPGESDISLQELDNDQSWTSWAWSYVPQILPTEEEMENQEQTTQKKKPPPLTLSIGMYAHKASVTFKLTESLKEKVHYGPKKIAFEPFLLLEGEGISLEILVKGINFFNLQVGFTNLQLLSQGHCICRTIDSEDEKTKVLCYGGDSLESKSLINYYSKSLFVLDCPANQNKEFEFEFDGDRHLEMFTEQYGLQRYGIIYIDYLYTMPVVHTESQDGSKSSVSEAEDNTAVFVPENSLFRFIVGACHLNVSSSMVHRIHKFIYCAGDHTYEPYYKNRKEQIDENRPLPTEEQVRSLETCIPLKTSHLTLLQPTAIIYPAEHPQCDISKPYRTVKPTQKKQKEKESAKPHSHIPCVHVATDRFDLQTTSPIWPKKLVRIVSKIAGPSSHLLHHCQSHTQVKLFGFYAGLVRLNQAGEKSHLVTVLSPCSGALYTKHLLFPAYWKNTHHSKSELMFELPQFSVNVSKANLLLGVQILSSWKQKIPKCQWIQENSLLEDVFPAESKKNLPVIEVSLSGLELKKCNTPKLKAFTGTLSSVQAILYDANQGSGMPILCAPANTSRLNTPEFFLKPAAVDEEKNDFLVFTYQLPSATGTVDVPSVLLLGVEGSVCQLDPSLLDWFSYSPREKLTRLRKEDHRVKLNLDIAQAASPLNASQVSVVSSGSTTAVTDSISKSQSVTQTTSNKQTNQDTEEVKSQKEKKTLGDKLGDIFPCIKMLQLQVEIKSSCMFVNQKHFSVQEPSLFIPQMYQSALDQGLSPQSFVVCMPHVRLASSGSKPMAALQEIPIQSMDVSLVGEKLPWTLSLDNLSIYTVLSREQIFPMLKPMSVGCTIGVSTKYSPPSSDNITALGLCLHTDMRTVTSSISKEQVKLCSGTIPWLLNLSSRVTSLAHSLFTSPSDKAEETIKADIPKHSSAADHTSYTEDVDATRTGTSGDFTSRDTTPIRDLVFEETVGDGIKLSLWLQWTLQKFELRFYKHYEVKRKDTKLILSMEDLTTYLDLEAVYAKVKVTCEGLNLHHKICLKDSDKVWKDGENMGILMSCHRDIANDFKVLSNKRWPSNSSINNGVGEDGKPRDLPRGFLNVTFTRALCKNVKQRLRKMNADMGGLQDVSENVIPAELYFHKYISELCINMEPSDFVFCAPAVHVLLESLNVFGKTRQRKLSKPATLATKSREKNKFPLITSSLLPLLYVNLSSMRIFLPVKHSIDSEQIIKDSEKSLKENAESGRVKTTRDHDLFVGLVHSVSVVPQADNPLPRYAVEKELYSRALNAGIDQQPGSAVENRQYQMEFKGLSLCTGCWGDFLERRHEDSVKESTTPVVQMPALEWNSLMKPDSRKDEKEIVLLPMSASMDMKIVAAPAIVYTPKDGQDMLPVLVCGHTIELNASSDLDFFVSTNQIQLMEKLVHQSVPVLFPGHRKAEDDGREKEDENVTSDSGIGSDVSVITIKKDGIDLSSQLSTSFEQNQKVKLVSPFDVLLTAGRISCTLYSHKEAKSVIVMEKKNQLRPSSGRKMKKSDLDLKETSSMNRNEEATSSTNDEMCFPFTNMNEEESDSEVIIPSGATYICPFVYLYFSQPHTLLSCQQNGQKFEMSCYDILIKGPHCSSINITDNKLLPECADFSLYWIETRAGQPHPKTGIPPSLYTLRITDFLQEPACVNLKMERPMKINLSMEKVTHVQQFVSDLMTGFGSRRRSKVDKEAEVNVAEVRDDIIEPKKPMAVEGLLTKIEKLELQTEQMVVSMETNPEFKSSGIIGCVDKVRLGLEMTQTETGLLCGIDVYTYLGDMQLKTVYQKQPKIFIGPFTLTTDTTLEWYEADDKSNSVPMATVNMSASLVPLSIGQENVLSILQLGKQIESAVKHFSPKKRSEVTPVRSEVSPLREKSPKSDKHVLIAEQSIDDLRTGKFQYIKNPDSTNMLASPGEIIFCSRDNQGNSSMTWCYNQPRVLSLIQFTPIPFNIPRDLNEAEDKETLIPCTLYYLDAVTRQFVPYIDFELSEHSRTILQLPEVKDVNIRDLINASMWRVMIRNNLHASSENEDPELEAEVAILPESLAASMRVDSCYVPSLIPLVQFCLTAPFVEVRVLNHLSCLGQLVPDKLQPFKFDDSMPGEQEFCVLSLQRITLLGSHILGRHARTSAQLTSRMHLDVVEYRNLTLQKFIHPLELYCDSSYTAGNVCPLVEGNVTISPMMISVGKGAVHTLNCATKAWSQMLNPIKSDLPCVVFNHYVICNDTSLPVRFGQIGTDENLVLKSRDLHCYSWRTHKTKQQLHMCLDGKVWKWCEPFGIDTDGETVRVVRSADLQYTLIIQVTQLTNVQKQIKIRGQLMMYSCLTQHVEVQIHTLTDVEVIQLIVGGEIIAPSYVLEPEEIKSMKLRPLGSSGPWSNDVYVTGERMKESRTVKVHLSDNSFYHIWCHVFCHHLQTATLTKILFSPLYVVRSHLPQTLFAIVETPKLKNSRKDLEIPGQGRELQLHCVGSETTHLLTFQLKPGTEETTSQSLTLSTGMIGQVERSPLPKSGVDQLLAKWKTYLPRDWPYCFQTKERNEGDIIMADTAHKSRGSETLDMSYINEAQLSVSLNVNLSEYLPGCNTLLVDVSPWCLMTNQSDLDLIVMDTSGAQWNLPGGRTFIPPKFEGEILLGLRIGSGVICSGGISLSEEEVSAQRYRQDQDAVLYMDSYVHTRIVVEAQITQIYFLTLQSSVRHQMRIITILESICVSNLTDTPYITSLQCAGPRLGKVKQYLESPALTIPSHLKAKSNTSDLSPLPVWCLISNNQPLHENETLVHYLSLQPISSSDASQASTCSHWSNPVRLLASEEGTRTTVSVLSSESDHLVTRPLVITGHQRNGVSYFVLRADNSPACLIHNLTAIPVYYGHHNVNITTKDITVQEQTELLEGPPFVVAGSNTFYTPAIINGSFLQTITNTKLPSLHFAVRKEDFLSAEDKKDSSQELVWSGNIDCNSDTEIFVSLPDCLDIKVKVKRVAMVTNIMIEPISRAEVSAKEIRSRIKGKEDSVKLVTTESHSPDRQENKETPENKKSSAKSEVIPLEFTPQSDRRIQLSMGLRFHHISVSLRNESALLDEISEVMRVSLDELYLAYHPSGHSFGQSARSSHTCFSACVGAVQVDNQMFYTKGLYDFPVLFMPQEADDTKNTVLPNFDSLSVIEKYAVLKSLCFAHLQFVMETNCLGNSVMRTCELGVSSFTANVDDSFVFRILKEIEMLIPTKLSHNLQHSLQIKKLPKSFSNSSCALSCPIKIEHVCIHPISVVLSVHASLKMFIASDRTPLSFSKFEKKGICGTSDQFVRTLAMHYATGALFRAGIVVGSLEILGNPTGLVRSIGSGVSDLFKLPYTGLTQGPGAFVAGVTQGMGSFAKNISAGMITSVTSFASSVSKNMDRLSLDDSYLARQEERRRQHPNGVTSGLRQGLTGFGMSLLGAVAGLADQPIQNVIALQEGSERKQSSAASGIVTGMGKGLVGVFTKPIGGAAEFVSQTGQGLLQGTGLAGNQPGPRYQADVISVSSCNSSRLKYVTKFLPSISNTEVLSSVVARYMENSGSEFIVTLLITEDLVILVNCEDDIQQQAFSLAELDVTEKAGNPNLLTLRWKDTYHQTSTDVEDENKDRVEAFIDGAASYVQMSSQDLQQGSDNATDSISSSPASHRGVIPQFHFLLNPAHRDAFVTALHLAKNRLSGKGFAV